MSWFYSHFFYPNRILQRKARRGGGGGGVTSREKKKREEEKRRFDPQILSISLYWLPVCVNTVVREKKRKWGVGVRTIPILFLLFLPLCDCEEEERRRGGDIQKGRGSGNDSTITHH